MKQAKRALTLFFIMLTIPTITFAQYTEGRDYTQLPTEIRNKPAIAQLIANNPNKTQLLLFFNFGCSACAKFDPIFENWENKQHHKNLVIYREPVAFENNWEDLAKLYFVMKDLKPYKNLNAKIFQGIHEQDLKLWQESAMEEFFVANGYNAEQVKNIYNSYEVEMQAKQSDDLAKAFDINQTPCIVINGPDASYLLTIEQAGGNKETMLKIADYLINK